jgi:uncharacterized protein YbcV (DUF1398 family)
MFTLNDIQDSHSKLKSGTDFPAYVQSLIHLGVTGFDVYVEDRHAEYYGKNKFSIKEEGKYPSFDVAVKVDGERFRNILKLHQTGRTNYVTFCEQLAKVGIEKWTLNVKKLTCTYYDAQGNEMLVEPVTLPKP